MTKCHVQGSCETSSGFRVAWALSRMTFIESCKKDTYTSYPNKPFVDVDDHRQVLSSSPRILGVGPTSILIIIHPSSHPSVSRRLHCDWWTSKARHSTWPPRDGWRGNEWWDPHASPTSPTFALEPVIVVPFTLASYTPRIFFPSRGIDTNPKLVTLIAFWLFPKLVLAFSILTGASQFFLPHFFLSFNCLVEAKFSVVGRSASCPSPWLQGLHHIFQDSFCIRILGFLSSLYSVLADFNPAT